jgi:selenocysteine lyase/cysteine desulfurase
MVLLDSYQAAGAVDIDVRALDVDFLTAGTVKYLLGSSGLGFLYCRADLIEGIVPTQTGWFADENIFDMDIFDYSPSPTARRFQAGTPPIPNIYAGLAGIGLVAEVGVAATARHVQVLNDRLIAGADELGARVVTPRDPARRGPMVAIATTDEHAMVDALAAEGIITSSRDGNLRVASHFYNNTADIDAVLAAVARHRELLA